MPASVESHLVVWSAAILLLTLVIHEVTSSTSGFNTTLSVRKCHCDKQQTWNGMTCHDSVDELYLHIYNSTDFDLKKQTIDNARNTTIAIPSSTSNVTFTKFQCPKNLLRATVDSNVFLLPDGRLLRLDDMKVFTSDLFCIEHFFWIGHHPVFIAEICLPPEVPQCCPTDHLLDHNGTCRPGETVQAPPLPLGHQAVDWRHVGGGMVNVTCGEHEYHRYLNLRPGEAVLWNVLPTAELHWTLPFWIPSQSWKSKYCVALQEVETGELQYVAQICFKNYDRIHQHHCTNNSCVRKCCPPNKLYYRDKCEDILSHEEAWQPSQISGYNDTYELKIVYGEPGCKAHSVKEVHLFPNGSILEGPDGSLVPPSRYCLDNQLVGDTVVDQLVNLSVTDIILVCYSPQPNTCTWHPITVKVVLGVSCVFLVATLAVYLGVAELRDRTYGRCLVSMVSAMLITYLTLMFGPKNIQETGCYPRAFIGQMSALAMFFWLNVMCFDMWKILSGSTVQHHSLKVFLGYSLYAWGCPLVISTVTLILDIYAPANIILPGFAKSCWFAEDAAYWAYFSGFILVLVFVNIIFFIHVTVILHKKLKERTSTFETNSSRTTKTTKPKQQVWLFAKLFVVMGVMWVADIISAVSHRGTCYWAATDIINGLQGVFIFIVSVCNKDNLKKVKEAWRPRVQVLRQTFTSASGQASQKASRGAALSIDDTDASRKTSITSLPRKFSQASNFLFPSSSKKTATLSPADSANANSERKGSNVSIKDIIPLSSLQE